VKKRWFTPSPALVVSLIALFVALGGTSYAAITALPANSVGTTQLKNNAVTGAKIKDGTVAAADISSSAAGTVKVVGGPGAPVYQGPWASAALDLSGDDGVKFYKDAFGVVHLQGSATTGIVVLNRRSASQDTSGVISTSTIFTLPIDYRPAANLWFAAYGSGGSAAYIEITSAGVVEEVFGSTTFMGLSNISFKAGV
jgi:hypothetical protein